MWLGYSQGASKKEKLRQLRLNSTTMGWGAVCRDGSSGSGWMMARMTLLPLHFPFPYLLSIFNMNTEKSCILDVRSSDLWSWRAPGVQWPERVSAEPRMGAKFF